jgi:hypothetical protein
MKNIYKVYIIYDVRNWTLSPSQQGQGRMSATTTLTDDVRRSSHGNKVCKENEWHTDWKGRKKTVSADDTIVYMKTPRNQQKDE